MTYVGPIEKATRTELRGTATKQPALYAIAIKLARTADLTESARDVATLLKELRATVSELRATAPPAAKVTGPADEVKRRREIRRAEAAGL